MKPWIWLRGLAVVFALFTLGHTVGTWPRITRGADEATVVDAMQSFRFPIMGFTRSYWEFYRGFSLTISALLAVLMVIAWQVATLSRRDPRQAVPMAATLVIACVANAVLAWRFFFAGPLVMSVVALTIATVALWLLLRSPRLEAMRA